MSTNVSVEKNDNGIQILAKTETHVQATLTVEDELVKGVYEACREMIVSLKETGGKINGENTVLLTKLVKEVVELADGFKYPPNHWDNFVPWQRAQWNSHMLRKMREDINLLSFHSIEHRRMEVDNKFQEIIRMFQ